jgi:hypothetical protein
MGIGTDHIIGRNNIGKNNIENETSSLVETNRQADVKTDRQTVQVIINQWDS